MADDLMVPAIVNDVLGISLIGPRRERGRLVQRLSKTRSRQRVVELVDRLDAYYADIEAVSYPSGRLVPRLWNSYFAHPQDENGRRPWPVAEDVVRQALLVADAVEIEDPLPAAARRAVESGDWAVLTSALDWWRAVAPLVKTGALSVAPEGWGAMPGFFIPSLGYKNAEFRAAFVANVLENEPRIREAVKTVPHFHGLRPVEEPFDFMNFCSLVSVEVGAYDVLDDLTQLVHVRRTSSASAWFPTPRHYELFGIYASCGLIPESDLEKPGGVSPLLRVELPDASRVPLRTIIDLRRDEEVFDEWRQELRKLIGLLGEVSRNEDKDLRLALEAEMAEAAGRFGRKLTRERKGLATGGFKSVGLGIISGVAGGAVTGSVVAAAASAAAGSASAAAAEVAVGAVAGRARRRALTAARDIGLVLSGRTLGD